MSFLQRNRNKQRERDGEISGERKRGLEKLPLVGRRPVFRPPYPPPPPQPTPTQAMYRTNCRFVIGCRIFVGWCDPIMCCLSLTVGPCLIQGDVSPGRAHTYTHTDRLCITSLKFLWVSSQLAKHYLTCEHDYYGM